MRKPWFILILALVLLDGCAGQDLPPPTTTTMVEALPPVDLESEQRVIDLYRAQWPGAPESDEYLSQSIRYVCPALRSETTVSGITAWLDENHDRATAVRGAYLLGATIHEFCPEYDAQIYRRATTTIRA